MGKKHMEGKAPESVFGAFQFKKGDVLKLRIEDMGVDGEGIGKVENVTFFVKDAVVGDRVTAKVMKMKKSYGYARLLEIVEPSPYRTEPKCEFHRQCGGCQLQALSYAKQLEFKEQKVRNNLIRIGGFQDVDGVMEPILGMEEPYYYRNKAQFPVGRDKEGRIVAGFYASRSHNIIPNRRCHLGDGVNERVLDIVIGFMEEFGIEPYDETAGNGLVRHVLVRKGFFTGEVMVCLVINGHSLPHRERLVSKLCKVEGMTSITLNVNERNTNVILGEELILLWGKDFITDTIGDIRYQISPLSFYQVNPVQTRHLYETALQYAGLTGAETVWDLYCGIGTISLFLAREAKMVYGVEIVGKAIENARDNAALNGIENVEFFVGKAEEVLPEFYERGNEGDADSDAGGRKAGRLGSDRKIPGSDQKVQGREMRHPDVIVVDPPRKGCDERCLETIVKMRPERVVYVSCDSATLARDLKYLCGNGYELKKVQAVDMFPQTVGVESVVLLSKLKSSKHIEVELKMDELDLTAAESKATYEEIKEYVLKHSGLKVSSLYIAQVKQKYGLIERENYNKLRIEDVKQPKCPVEKEKAIREAFRHFQMISSKSF